MLGSETLESLAITGVCTPAHVVLALGIALPATRLARSASIAAKNTPRKFTLCSFAFSPAVVSLRRSGCFSILLLFFDVIAHLPCAAVGSASPSPTPGAGEAGATSAARVS